MELLCVPTGSIGLVSEIPDPTMVFSGSDDRNTAPFWENPEKRASALVGGT